MDVLLDLVPELRVIGMEHAMVSRGIILGPNMSYVVSPDQEGDKPERGPTPTQPSAKEGPNTASNSNYVHPMDSSGTDAQESDTGPKDS